MKALISPQEIINNFDSTSGYRIAQVEATPFEVAQPLYWVDCPEDCSADLWYFNRDSETCQIKPIQPVELEEDLGETL